MKLNELSALSGQQSERTASVGLEDRSLMYLLASRFAEQSSSAEESQ